MYKNAVCVLIREVLSKPNFSQIFENSVFSMGSVLKTL